MPKEVHYQEKMIWENISTINKMKKRQLTYTEAIKEATEQIMSKDKSVFIIGEGVPDPKGVFGTTIGLQKKFGKDRVMDMPLSENGLTGFCIGAAMSGLRPIMTHQRIDFTLLSLDQIINNAAKMSYMFGGNFSVPLVIRMVIGRGWGQGAQHSQNLQAIFSHIPGLKVVMPSNAYDAKGLLISAVKDNNPVMFIEHRWLHNLSDFVPENIYEVPIGKSKIIRSGIDLTIVATSYMNVEAIKTHDYLKKIGISVEVIDVRSLKPFDDETIIKSVKKTGHLLVLDSGYYSGGFAGEVIARISEKAYNFLKSAPQRLTLPDLPTPTSKGLTKYYYPQTVDVVKKSLSILNKKNSQLIKSIEKEMKKRFLDVPDKSFTGPF
jgi:pyruvate/2-oxoglutarate/acetoin dehydrogenase E1 component